MLDGSPASSNDQVRDRRIRHVVNLVHLNPRLRTSDLAAEVGLSPAHLERRFKAEIGKTITDYSRELRLDTAQKLLVTTFQTEQEIALSVGIPDLSNFIRCFKKRFGVTPRKYRNAA
jgi:transcriptional regulator GlxA family with amidase domain